MKGFGEPNIHAIRELEAALRSHDDYDALALAGLLLHAPSSMSTRVGLCAALSEVQSMMTDLSESTLRTQVKALMFCRPCDCRLGFDYVCKDHQKVLAFALALRDAARADDGARVNEKDALIGKLSRAVAGTNDLEARVAILTALLERAMTADDPSEWLSDAQEYLAAIRSQR